jgi:hypothetical protein
MGPTSSWNADKQRLFKKDYYFFQINIDSSLSLEINFCTVWIWIWNPAAEITVSSQKKAAARRVSFSRVWKDILFRNNWVVPMEQGCKYLFEL